jgi:hypothetical protein
MLIYLERRNGKTFTDVIFVVTGVAQAVNSKNASLIGKSEILPIN